MPTSAAHLPAPLRPPAIFLRIPLATAAALGLLIASPPWSVPKAAAQVDPTTSFYVPQSGAVATPVEGTAATRFFRACPNNDGGSSLPNNARIKVVLKDAGGVAIAGVPAADICLLFNGGTLDQGFTGSGADSIISNSAWNASPLCPDVTCIPADAATDATGTTYITFAGSTPGSPGVATRDPNRKWGHYDSAIPVIAMGEFLSGRLTTASATGSYTLLIKNFDFLDGLGAVLDEGEAVTAGELTALMREVGVSPVMYWFDLDSNGSIGTGDLNIIISHLNHDCDTPNNP